MRDTQAARAVDGELFRVAAGQEAREVVVVRGGSEDVDVDEEVVDVAPSVSDALLHVLSVLIHPRLLVKNEDLPIIRP